jgi:hypothetical protein
MSDELEQKKLLVCRDACHFDPRLEEVCAQRAPLFEIKSPTIRHVALWQGDFRASSRSPKCRFLVPQHISCHEFDLEGTSLDQPATRRLLRPIRLVEFASEVGAQSPENDMTCNSHGACFPVLVSCRNFTYVVHASYYECNFLNMEVFSWKAPTSMWVNGVSAPDDPKTKGEMLLLRALLQIHVNALFVMG